MPLGVGVEVGVCVCVGGGVCVGVGVICVLYNGQCDDKLSFCVYHLTI